MRDLKKMVQNAKIVIGTPHANYTSAASVSDVVSMKNYGHLTILIFTGGWAAATAAVTLNQCTNVAAAGAKALTFAEHWTGVVSLTSDTWTRVATTANTFNLTTADSLYAIEINADDLDVDNSFDCVKLLVASPGANNDYYGALFVLTQGRYLDESPSSAIID